VLGGILYNKHHAKFKRTNTLADESKTSDLHLQQLCNPSSREQTSFNKPKVTTIKLCKVCFDEAGSQNSHCL